VQRGHADERADRAPPRARADVGRAAGHQRQHLRAHKRAGGIMYALKLRSYLIDGTKGRPCRLHSKSQGATD
jgi:hypothetical protein